MIFKKELDKGCALLIGGAKSGKSRIALDICNKSEKKKIFMATAQALDDEMKKRIQRHKAERGDDWITVEESIQITDRLAELDASNTVILLDCLTLWLNNLFMEKGESIESIQESIDGLLKRLSQIKAVVVIVSNEVGMGIVPENDLARMYRDVAGSLNQHIAQVAKKVVAVMAGLPVVLKDE
ncbi:MAG: bifunctional adenosylcobinamide kinase/adenosylcobinamide-phosphate guanylyltransferase [Deltaproteobacteria bacterium]|nr:bifunctional adenosylcobinamide kinase/adenosylcobinamide-phosphate guanylyltransferase [Deltaproteobacteria bacterium]